MPPSPAITVGYERLGHEAQRGLPLSHGVNMVNVSNGPSRRGDQGFEQRLIKVVKPLRIPRITRFAQKEEIRRPCEGV